MEKSSFFKANLVPIQDGKPSFTVGNTETDGNTDDVRAAMLLQVFSNVDSEKIEDPVENTLETQKLETPLEKPSKALTPDNVAMGDEVQHSKQRKRQRDDDYLEDEEDEDYNDSDVEFVASKPVKKSRTKAKVKREKSVEPGAPKKKRNKGKDAPLPKKISLPVEIFRDEQGKIFAMDVEDQSGHRHRVRTAVPGTVQVPEEIKVIKNAMYPLAITDPESCNRLQYYLDTNEDGFLHVFLNPNLNLSKAKSLLQCIINAYRNSPELGNRVSRRLTRLHKREEGGGVKEEKKKKVKPEIQVPPPQLPQVSLPLQHVVMPNMFIQQFPQVRPQPPQISTEEFMRAVNVHAQLDALTRAANLTKESPKK